MAGKEILFLQNTVIEFLIKEDIPTLDMHAWSQHAYTEKLEKVQQCQAADKHFKDGNTGITGQPYIGHQQTASTERHKGKNRWAHQRKTTCDSHDNGKETGTGQNVIHEMENFAYKKVCTHCFPHLQMSEHKHQQKNVFSQLG